MKTTDTICAVKNRYKQLEHEYKYASATFHFLTFFGHHCSVVVFLLLSRNELINPCVNHTGCLRLDCRFGDYSCSAGKLGHEYKIGQKVPWVYTSFEHSALGNKSRMLKGIPPPLPPSRTPPSSFGHCTLLLQDGRLGTERPCP